MRVRAATRGGQFFPRLGVACAALLGVHCQLDTEPGSGSGPSGVLVSLESDLAIPKDIDRIGLTATQAGTSLLSEDLMIGEGYLLIPAQVQILTTDNVAPIVIRGVASKNGVPRIERSAVITVPAGQIQFVRLPFNYLCDGTAGNDGVSICGDQETCNQGGCIGSSVTSQDLSTVDPSTLPDTAGILASTSDARCFDVGQCFAGAVGIDLDPQSCSIRAPMDVDVEHLNVALRFAPGGAGVCDAQSCFVALAPGDDGWAIDGGRIVLIDSICHPHASSAQPASAAGTQQANAAGAQPADAAVAQPISPPTQVAITNRCLTKGRSMPVCGKWSSATTPQDQPVSVGMPIMSENPPPEGKGCDGAASEMCGNCGTKTRVCHDGMWSEFSACSGEGECAPRAAQSCGADGTQSCGNDCHWGACSGERCEGPAIQACGMCGTQSRRCSDGAWSDWGACMTEGACMPNETRACGSGGTQTCGGNCQWGACDAPQVCSGPSTQACGNCGTRSRACDSATATWSEWGECTDEGECAVNETRECGSGGTQVCGGDCIWDETCYGQTCEGEASQSCGNCGVQTRSCDRDAGTWSDWSDCTLERDCSPGDSMPCGADGRQFCNAFCLWDPLCIGQACSGSAFETCANCGTRWRLCDGTTAEWLPWSTCLGGGSCEAGQWVDCGDGGSAYCGNNCQPGNCACSGPRERSCGNCGAGMQSRDCDVGSNRWTNWSDCVGEQCAPGQTRNCQQGGRPGTQTCDDCQWGRCCAPNCNGRECGPDSCGGSCGTCGGNESCDGGQCTCTPDCRGKECGSDGCSGSCGTCSGNEMCTAGQCNCSPSCNGKECGPDGCNGSCGTCSGNDMCNGQGQCVCTPSCGGKECGPDGCSGRCGTCSGNDACVAGQCVCTPSCGGKDCGSDGCTGSCGTCSGNDTCNGQGKCVCTPSCGGKECGPDGCAGNCGMCGAGRSCQGGQCIDDPPAMQ